MILETLPTPEEFYETYWGKKPFVIRNFIPQNLINALIDGNTLAGLALEEEINSRIITNNATGNEWHCEHGPFDEDHFTHLGEQNWSLLVQNVEHYHEETANLLKHVQFSPRWLLDDIMVSYSAPGGSVGPHTDSYHTFLIQGMGKRSWKISQNQIDDTRYADNPDVKVLKHGFDGETFEVTAGDIIYMPPFFGHEGKTLETAMTFSIGFLGPKLSEILGEYAQHLQEHDEQNKRYLGTDLGSENASFTIAPSTQKTIQDNAITAIQSENFTRWLATYFASPTHDGIHSTNKPISNDELNERLQKGAQLYRPEHTKIAITQNKGETLRIASGEFHSNIHERQTPLIEHLNNNQSITQKSLKSSSDRHEATALLTALHNNNILSFVPS